MFTTEQLQEIQKMSREQASIQEIATALGIHRSTLERRLLRHHGLKLEEVRTCRLSNVKHTELALV